MCNVALIVDDQLLFPLVNGHFALAFEVIVNITHTQ